MSPRHTSASASKPIRTLRRAREKSIGSRAQYERYSAQKAMWEATHPAATNSEYEAAMRAIAKACGV